MRSNSAIYRFLTAAIYEYSRQSGSVQDLDRVGQIVPLKRVFISDVSLKSLECKILWILNPSEATN